MNNTIKCPNCGKDVEVTEALKHQVEEVVLAEVNEKHQQELKELRRKAEEEAVRKVKEQMELTLKDRENEIGETREQNQNLKDQLLETTKLIRGLKKKDEQRDLEMERRLNEERDKLKEEILKASDEERRLKELELRKQLEDALKVNDELKRKLQQGSQQTQGEVLELDLEQLLRETFRDDEIEPVGKGITGADIKHIVKSPRGYVCGVILWESKRTKYWEDKWLSKLKDDLRSEKGNVAAIVTSVLPDNAKRGMWNKDGVWVCGYELIVPLAVLLRKALLDVAYQKALSTHRGEKSDLLYAYITGHEFHQQLEAIVEVFLEMKDQVGRERMVYEKQWKMREAQITRAFTATASVVGTMQGLIGATTLQIKGLEVLELDDGK